MLEYWWYRFLLWILWAAKTFYKRALNHVRFLIFFSWEMRILLINKVEIKNVNPILAWSSQKYGLEMVLSLTFHHYPRLKKEQLNDIKKSYILGWFLAVHLQTTSISVISLRLHTENPTLCYYYFWIFLCAWEGPKFWKLINL